MHEFRLGNGMRFAVLERHQSPTLAAALFVLAGEMDEADGQRGASGLVINMFVNGTETIGSKSPASEKAALAAVESAMDRLKERSRTSGDEFSLGRESAETAVKMALEQARQWESDGFRRVIMGNGLNNAKAVTSTDSSTMSWTMPSERSEVWFKLLGEWLARPSFRGFYRARDRHAASQSSDGWLSGNQTDGMASILSWEAFPGSPYSRPSGRDNAGRLRASAVEAFFRARYQPSNMAVALVGDITPGQARQWAERYFGSLAGEPKSDTIPQSPRARTGEYREISMRLSSVVGYRRPPHGHADDIYFDLLTGLLTGGKIPYYSTELTKELRLASSVGVVGNFPGDRLESLFVLAAAPAPGVKVEQLEAAQVEIAEKFAHEPVTAERLGAAVNWIQVDVLLSLQSDDQAAISLSRTLGMDGTIKGMEQVLDQLQSVTPAQFQNFAQKYLTPENRFLCTSGPPGKEKPPRGGEQK